MTTQLCPRCHREIAAEAAQCTSCGARLRCARCGAAVEQPPIVAPAPEYCKHCGAKLEIMRRPTSIGLVLAMIGLGSLALVAGAAGACFLIMTPFSTGGQLFGSGAGTGAIMFGVACMLIGLAVLAVRGMIKLMK